MKKQVLGLVPVAWVMVVLDASPLAAFEQIDPGIYRINRNAFENLQQESGWNRYDGNRVRLYARGHARVNIGQ